MFCFQPFTLDVFGAVDQVRLHALFFGQFAQSVGIGAVWRADHQHQIALLGDRLPVLIGQIDQQIAALLARYPDLQGFFSPQGTSIRNAVLAIVVVAWPIAPTEAR